MIYCVVLSRFMRIFGTRVRPFTTSTHSYLLSIFFERGYAVLFSRRILAQFLVDDGSILIVKSKLDLFCWLAAFSNVKRDSLFVTQAWFWRPCQVAQAICQLRPELQEELLG